MERTISSIEVVDVRISKGATGHSVAADTDAVKQDGSSKRTNSGGQDGCIE